MSGRPDPDDLETVDRAIAEFDGRHIAPLEQAADALDPSDAVLGDLADTCRTSDEAEQTAASWILKRLLERGARPTPETLDRIVCVMARVEGWEARLHFAQAHQWLEPTERQAAMAATTLARWFGSDKAFVRAWACDALWRLGMRHGSLQVEARRIATLAETDPAASVRARARNLPRRR